VLRFIHRIPIWVRLVVLIWLVIAIAWGGMLAWAAREQRAGAIAQALDFALSVHQMTLAGLTAMFITGAGAQRAVFLDQIRESNNIRALRVVRGEAVTRQFGPGAPGETVTDALERQVLERGGAIHEVRADGAGEYLRVVMPALAQRDYLGKDCLGCHAVAPGTVLGAVSMEISLAKVASAVREFAGRVYWAAFVVSLPLIALVYLLVTRSVTAPLGKMTAGLRRIAQGDVPANGRLEPVGSDEIAQAAGAFNAVMDEVRELLHSQRLASEVFENSPEGIVVCDPGGRILKVNPAFTATTGYSAGEAVGRTPAILKSGRQDAEFYRSFWHALKTAGRWQGDLWNRRKSGEIYAERLNVSAVRNERGEIENYIGVFGDITERKRQEALIAHHAYHDLLTGLPNRALFEDRLAQSLAAARRGAKRLAVLFLDLDRFKFVNDTLGHGAGDGLLKEVARRLRGCVREVDTVARLGGDEFTVLLPQIAEPANAQAVAEKVLEGLRQPFRLAGRELHVTSSIGISLYPEHGGDAETLMKKADAAMYHVKDQGRAGHCLFTESIAARPARWLQLDGDLRRALERDEIRVCYQPQVSLADGSVVGVEALARWHHPRLGVIPSAEFLPLAEESGLILEIGGHVLRGACAQGARWLAAGVGPLVIGVNLSHRQFHDGGLVALVRDALAGSGLPPERLELEVSESLARHDVAHTVRVMEALAALGTRLAIGEFGAAMYAAAHDLGAMPVGTVKLDRALVRDLGRDEGRAAALAGLVDLARAHRLRVVALGVERPDQLGRLKDLDCASAQGHLFSRAVEAEEIPALAGRRFPV
jgi:diguanylate cyclase (GGDEF)-like protein/PAS domain S-box-containing protein